MDITKIKTLVGITLEELVKKLDEQLPKDAYSAVPGAAGLTDIDPNYMRLTLNLLFGLCGIGWGYRYEPVDMLTDVQERTRSNGQGSRRVYTATLKRLTFWYKLLDEKSETLLCEVDASGGSENDVEAYAMKGAITNALGNAVSNIGFQQSVYLGLRSHETVRKMAVSKAASSKSTSAAKPDLIVQPEAVFPEKKVEPSSSAVEQSTEAKFVVTVGKRAGQTLGQIYADGSSGPEAIKFYTTMATGGNAEKEKLRNAAIAFLAKHNGHVLASVAA
jgi:hypothetical protein